MPIYEFQCQECGKVKEYILSISEDNPDSCVSCGAKNLRKMISLSSFVLKGQGWYETDFKNKTNKKQSKKIDKKSEISKSVKSAPSSKK